MCVLLWEEGLSGVTGLSVIVELLIACTASHFCGQDVRLKCALKYKKKIKIKILLKHRAFDYKGHKNGGWAQVSSYL